MESVFFSYPRVPLEQATRIWSEIENLSLDEITQKCNDVSLAGTEFYPLAEIRAEEDELRNLRMLILDRAARYGFPSTTSSTLKVAFESELIQIFHDEINMSPAEASHLDVWHYFNLKLLADITVWRWGTRSETHSHWTVTPERLYGFNRNMFGRIWWRNHLLGPELSSQLGEDATVAIVERPKLFSYPPFAKAVATRALNNTTTFSYTNVLREVTLLFSRKMAVLSIFAMDIEVLNVFVNDVFNEAESSMIKKTLAP